MKTFITFIFTFIIASAYGQINVKLTFWDECSKSYINLEYELYDIESDSSYQSKKSLVNIPFQGYYLLNATIVNGDYRSSVSTNLTIKETQFYTDTISIPQIRFTTELTLHSKYWNYFNCDNLCEGKEVSYYANGNKQIEGLFSKGKPTTIIEYRENGNPKTKYWLKTGYLDYERIEYYDDDGQLEEYETYVNRKRKTIKRIYNPEGVFLAKHVEKHTIVK